MSYPEYARKNIDDFLRSIANVGDAYQNDSFSYLTIKNDDGFVLVQGTLYLNSQEPKLPKGRFETEHIRAGHLDICKAPDGRRAFIEQLGQGRLETPEGAFLFPPNSSGSHGANYHPFHEIGLQAQRRLGILSILGAETAAYLHAQQPHLDWEARASPTPYDGLQEILSEYQPGIMQGVNRVDIAALDLVAIDTSSVVEGETATLMVRSAVNADPDQVSVGFRVLDQGRVVKRGKLAGTEFDWKSGDGVNIGTAKFAVPKAGVIQAFAQHNGIVYHHYYFADPQSFQNSRRAAYEAFDPKMATFHDILSKAQSPRPEAREFEAAMPWLFWMLGFSPAHVGGPPRMREAADFLVATPNGNLAVVECTVGLLKDDSKLPRLHDRTEAVKRNLSASGAKHLRVLPVIITAKSQAEIRPDIEQAEKLGVFIITRDGIERLVERTMFPQNADQLFEQAEQEVAAKLAKYQTDNSIE